MNMAGGFAGKSGGSVKVVHDRLQAAEDADVIYVLGAGCIVEFGSHEDLMALDGSYAEMYKLGVKDE